MVQKGKGEWTDGRACISYSAASQEGPFCGGLLQAGFSVVGPELGTYF